MTLDEAKKLTVWMRSQGVSQFSVDGVAVVFHPKAVTLPGAEATQPATQQAPQEPSDAGELEMLLPA